MESPGSYEEDSVRRCKFWLVPLFFRIAIRRSGGLSQGEGRIPLLFITGRVKQYKKGATADIKEQVPIVYGIRCEYWRIVVTFCDLT